MGRRALGLIWKTFEAKFALIVIDSELLRGLEGSYKVFFVLGFTKFCYVSFKFFFLDLNVFYYSQD